MRKIIAIASLCIMSACDSSRPSADEIQKKQQEALSSEATRQVGMPGIQHFTERRMMRKILELRDQSLTTYTYVMTIQGTLFHVCDSVGYGLPYATQYTNPSYIADHYSGGWVVLPQADPNGLFSPSSAEGTWVACVNEKKKDYDVVYVEPRITVSPFKLRSVGEWQLAAPRLADDADDDFEATKSVAGARRGAR